MLGERGEALFRMRNINAIRGYSFEHSLIFGSLPGIVNQPGDRERTDLLKAYTQIYLEEEIRAEALSRKIGQYETYRGKVKTAYVVTTGRLPEKLTDVITAIPWQFL